MRRTFVRLAAVLAVAWCTASVPAAVPSVVEQGVSPAFGTIGPLAFAPDGTLYAGDTASASIVALNLGAAAEGGAAGSAAIDGIDQKVAALLGTASSEVTITDLAVHPKTRQTYLSVMRGMGASARPALLRVDGAGQVSLVSMDGMAYSKIMLPNPPEAAPASGRSNRSQAIMDLAYLDGRVYVAGLSNEEFASKLWSIAYPFTNADRGTSIEIFHGNHGRLETRSPIFSFVPYTVNGEPTLIAGYLCTPLVKIPVSALQSGAKVLGTTIAELGAGNRPIDMILYKKDGAEYLLMSNTNRGVMKIPTAGFGSASPITAPVAAETAGITYQTIAALDGVVQMDALDASRAVIITRTNGGSRLQIVALP